MFIRINDQSVEAFIVNHEIVRNLFKEGYLFIMFFIFLRQVLDLFLGSWFSAFCFSAFAFPAFCFSWFSAFHASLLLCFTCFFSFLLLCFSAVVLLCLSNSTVLFFLFFCFIFSPICNLNDTLKTLGETQRNPKEILIRTPDKKPYMQP